MTTTVSTKRSRSTRQARCMRALISIFFSLSLFPYPKRKRQSRLQTLHALHSLRNQTIHPFAIEVGWLVIGVVIPVILKPTANAFSRGSASSRRKTVVRSEEPDGETGLLFSSFSKLICKRDKKKKKKKK